MPLLLLLLLSFKFIIKGNANAAELSFTLVMLLCWTQGSLALILPLREHNIETKEFLASKYHLSNKLLMLIMSIWSMPSIWKKKFFATITITFCWWLDNNSCFYVSRKLVKKETQHPPFHKISFRWWNHKNIFTLQ